MNGLLKYGWQLKRMILITYGKFKINVNLRLKVETALAPDARKGFSFVIVKLKRYPS